MSLPENLQLFEHPYEYEANPIALANRFGSVHDIDPETPANCQTLIHLFIPETGGYVLEPHLLSLEMIVAPDVHPNGNLKRAQGDLEDGDVIFLRSYGKTDLRNAHAVPILRGGRVNEAVAIQTDHRLGRPVVMPLITLLSHPRYDHIITALRPVRKSFGLAA